MTSFEYKLRQFGKKVIIPLIWCSIILLLFTIGIIIQYTLSKSINRKSIIVILFILFIVYFIWILFVSVTKYQRETLLNDAERKSKWANLSKEYKQFYNHMHILGISMSIFMFISGVWLLIIRDSYGWFMLIMGINLLISNIILARKTNENR